MNLGEKLKAMRHDRGMTQLQVAIKGGLTPVAIARIESGVTENPHIKTVSSIARAFGMPISDLLAGVDMGDEDKLPWDTQE